MMVKTATASHQRPSTIYSGILRIETLESLLLDLGLGSGNGLSSIRVNEAAAELAVLVGGGLRGADTEAGRLDFSAACR